MSLIEWRKRLTSALSKTMGSSRSLTTAYSWKKQAEISSRRNRQRSVRAPFLWLIFAHFKKPDCCLIAWRCSKPTILTILPNVTLDLIPFEVSEMPTVRGILVEVGKSIHLTKDVEVQPSFTCLVRVYDKSIWGDNQTFKKLQTFARLSETLSPKSCHFESNLRVYERKSRISISSTRKHSKFCKCGLQR